MKIRLLLHGLILIPITKGCLCNMYALHIQGLLITKKNINMILKSKQLLYKTVRMGSLRCLQGEA